MVIDAKLLYLKIQENMFQEEEDIIRKANLYEKTCTASSSTTDLKIINVREQGNGKIYKKQPERHQQTSLKFGTLVRKR